MVSRHVIRGLTWSCLYDIPLSVRPACRALHLASRTPRTPDPSSKSIQVTAKRHAQSASSTRWLNRKARDPFARAANAQGLKSRAAFKLLQLNAKHKLFKPGMTVVDLGYAPGSWTQVAVTSTKPGGRVIGVDVLPAQPPRGASTIQGDFLSPDVQRIVREYVRDPQRGRATNKSFVSSLDEEDREDEESQLLEALEEESYVDAEKGALAQEKVPNEDALEDETQGRVVDIVLSDMWEPWPQTDGFSKMSISNPYIRLMNTTGVPFRDHAVSMDLCAAALRFSFDTLKAGGHFVCKFYQGEEDKIFKARMKRLFTKVHQEKPEASRKESREGYFVATRRKASPTFEDVFGD